MEEELTAARKTTLPGMEDPDAASSRRLKEMMRGGGGGDYRGGSEPKVGGGLAGIAGQFFDKPSAEEVAAVAVGTDG